MAKQPSKAAKPKPDKRTFSQRLADAAPPMLRAWVAEHALDVRIAIATLNNADVPAPPFDPAGDPKKQPKQDTSSLLPPGEYDHIIVHFSGGKDSVAVAIWAIETFGRERVELQHQCVDGRPGSAHVFDWACTESYCKAVAAHLGVPIYFGWREKGLMGEMQRDNQTSHGVTFQTPSGEIHVPIGPQAELATRRVLGPDGRVAPGMSPAWPAQSADLSIRWCSRIAKVDVGRRIITNDPRFSDEPYRQQALAARRAAKAGAKAAARHNPEKTRLNLLVLTGERREESGARARYAQCEAAFGTTEFRRVDGYRPVLAWPEVRVWAAMRRWGIVPHPCYWIGFGRASCETCIFAQAPEWATLREIHPERFDLFRKLEAWAGATISRDRSVVEQADRGESLYPRGAEPWRAQALRRDYTLPVYVDPSMWKYPPGAFRQTSGPT